MSLHSSRDPAYGAGMDHSEPSSHQIVTAPLQTFMDEDQFVPQVVQKPRGQPVELKNLNNRRLRVWDEHGKETVIRNPGSTFTLTNTFPAGSYRILQGATEVRILALAVEARQ